MPQTRLSNKPNIFPVNVVGSSTFGRYPKISLEKTFNMFISDEWLISFSGWKKNLEVIIGNNAKGRGSFVSIRQKIVVVVFGTAVYYIKPSVDSNPRKVVLQSFFVGNISTKSSDVFMDENLSNQISIVDGTYIYIYNHAIGSLTRQSVNSNLKPNYVTYHNTFFLIGNSNTKSNGAKWYAYSVDPQDPTKIVEKTELALETKPDYAIAVKRLPGQGNNVIVFGTSVCELFTQVGGLNNYERNSSINIDYGCLSVSTIAASDKYVFWLGVNEAQSPVIMAFTTGGAVSISTDGIDHLLGHLQYPEQSSAFFFRQDGHLFYQLTFYNEADNLTLMYDVDTKKFFNLTDWNFNYHPARDIFYYQNRVYFISLNNGCIYETNTDLTTYNENLNTEDESLNHEIPRQRICSSIRSPDAQQFRVKSLKLNIDQGNDPYFQGADLEPSQTFVTDEEGNLLTTETGQLIVTNDSQPDIPYIPRVDLSLSKDGARTFSQQVGINMNPLGRRQNIMEWSRPFGLTNDLVPQFRFWGRSYQCVKDGYVEVY